MKNFKYYMNQALRIIEKIPGINLQQVINVKGKYFLIIPKNGTRSIRDGFLKERNLSFGDEWCFINFYSKRKLGMFLEGKDVVLVLRHPLERLQSCWKQKLGPYRDNNFLSYFFMYFPYLKRDMTFDQFLLTISKIPASLCEKHFRPIDVTIPLKSKSLKMIHLSDLDDILELKKRSNVTAKIKISDTQKKIFNDRLYKRFKSEIEIYESLGRKF